MCRFTIFAIFEGKFRNYFSKFFSPELCSNFSWGFIAIYYTILTPHRSLRFLFSKKSYFASSWDWILPIHDPLFFNIKSAVKPNLWFFFFQGYGFHFFQTCSFHFHLVLLLLSFLFFLWSFAICSLIVASISTWEHIYISLFHFLQILITGSFWYLCLLTSFAWLWISFASFFDYLTNFYFILDNCWWYMVGVLSYVFKKCFFFFQNTGKEWWILLIMSGLGLFFVWMIYFNFRHRENPSK